MINVGRLAYGLKPLINAGPGLKKTITNQAVQTIPITWFCIGTAYLWEIGTFQILVHSSKLHFHAGRMRMKMGCIIETAEWKLEWIHKVLIGLQGA